MIASDCRTIGKNTENAGHCGFAVTFFAALIVKDQSIDANNALWRNTGQSYNTGHIRYYKSVILNTGNQKHAIIKTEIADVARRLPRNFIVDRKYRLPSGRRYFCYLTEMMMATKVPNAIIKDNASYTLIVSPPLLRSGKPTIGLSPNDIIAPE